MLGIPLVHLVLGNLDDLVRRATVFVNGDALADLVLAPLGKDDGPDHVVQSTESNDTKTRQTRGAVEEVERRGVDAACGRHPGHDEEVDLGQEVEDDHPRPAAVLRRREVEVLALAADEEEARRHERKEKGRGIVLEGNDKVEGVSGRGSEDHDGGHGPNDGEGTQRRTEGLGRDPKLLEGKNTLTADFANDTSLTDDHGEDVASSTEHRQDGEALGSALAKQGLEEEGRGGLARREDRGLGQGGKVRNVDQEVENKDDKDGRVGGALDGPDRVLNLVGEVERVVETTVTVTCQ